jgi:monoamine oxidase
MTRREFLWVSLTAAVSSLLAIGCGRRHTVSQDPGQGLSRPTGDSESIFDCIVLGAGIAGVTAARNLQEKGLRVLLLEGSARVGGRMYSKRDFVLNPGYIPDPASPEERGKYIPVEAGAEYIHVRDVERYREFWDEITRHGFTTSKFPKTTLLHNTGLKARNRLFFPVWERTLTTDEAVKKDDEIRGAAPMLFMLELKDLFDPSCGKDVSARTFAKSQGYKGRGITITEYTLSAHTPGLLDEPPPASPPGQVNPNDTISVAGILADEIQDQLIEPSEFRLELEREGEPRVCGYDTLPRKISQEFLAAGGTIRKSDDGDGKMKVVRVERTDGGIVTITTKGGERFSGRSAVCTFSVGMLDPATGEGDTIFVGLLTDEKRKALEVVKMGAITKFSLEFKERLWDRDGGGNMSVLSNPEGRARTFFSSFPDEAHGPHVLTGLLMGKDHLAIKNLSDGEAIQFLLDELHKIYDPNGPRWTPERVLAGRRDGHGNFLPNYHRQDWEKDEFAKGGNSFLKFTPPEEGKMQVTKAREALKNPRETLPLFWAGEATAPAYHPRYQPLAVHGAYISGVRSAEDVHHYLTVCRGDPKCFEKYYKKRYLRRTFLDHIVGFLEDLFS